MEDLRPALQQALREWDYFERVLIDASLHTTRVHCSLQHPPVFSLKQAEGHMDFLEVSGGKKSENRTAVQDRIITLCAVMIMAVVI